MNINYEKQTIEMTRSEAEAAGVPNSEKFNELLSIRASFSNYSITIKKASSKRGTYKGLNYEYMEEYIKKHNENDKKNLEEFYRFRGLDKNGKKDASLEEHSYGEIKMWFLVTFPEIERFNNETNKKLDEVRAKRAEKRMGKTEEKPNINGQDNKEANESNVA